MAYVTLNGYPLLVVPPIQTDMQIQTAVKPLIDGTGSITRRTGIGGRNLQLTVRVHKSDISYLQELYKLDWVFTLVSQSYAQYDGKYQMIGYKEEEKMKGLFTVTLTLQEYVVPNITTQNFTNWQIKSSTPSSTVVTKNGKAVKQGTTAFCKGVLDNYKGNETAALKKHPECLKYLRKHFCERMWSAYGKGKKSKTAKNRTLTKYPVCKGYI